MDKNLEEKAYYFAKEAHGVVTRKLSNDLYITHPIRVAAILKTMNVSLDLVIAGYLHDVVEDTNYTLDDIKNEFGEKVSNLVKSNTENKNHTWMERKTHTISSIKSKTLEERLLLVADKYANLEDILKALNGDLKEDVWNFFKRNKKDQQWYYTSILEELNNGLSYEEKNHPLFIKYEEIVNKVFK